MSLEARVTVLEEKFEKEMEERKLLLEATHGVVCEILKEQHNDRVENARRFDKILKKQHNDRVENARRFDKIEQEMAADRRENARRFDKIEDTLVQIINRLS